MATSSIFTNIKITDTEEIEAFVEALEFSAADSMPQPKAPRDALVSDHDAIRKLWNKRMGNK